ncbi:MAG TPA: hypothetical protein VHA52_09915 [Candidatus Babeliaceae bacterium]|nr:hypothetical protein [Candidatus Babeliaceae bacterium]
MPSSGPFGLTFTNNEQPPWLKELYEKLAASLNSSFFVPDPRTAAERAPRVPDPRTAAQIQRGAPDPRTEEQRQPRVPDPRTAAQRMQGHAPRYTDSRLAPFNEVQNNAFLKAQQTGKYAPYFEDAKIGLQQAAKDFPTEFERYMNPFIGSVLDNLATQYNRNFTENVLPTLESQFIGLGQHGSGKHQDLAARAARDSQEALLRKQLEAMSSAYEHSGRMFNADQERILHGAQTQADLGSKAQASHLNDIAALSSVGDQMQQQKQRDLDLKYEQFVNEINYPGDKMVQQAAILNGIPYQGQVYGNVQIPQAQPRVNTLGQIGSLAGNVLGARMAQGIPRKRGGRISAPYFRY